MRVPASLCMLALLAGGVFGTSSLQAAESACKGLATDVCSGNAGCSWVKPHKNKNGKEIAGFCRKKPSRQSAAPKAPAKAS